MAESKSKPPRSPLVRGALAVVLLAVLGGAVVVIVSTLAAMGYLPAEYGFNRTAPGTAPQLTDATAPSPATTAPRPTAPAPRTDFDVSYIADEFNTALVLHPRRIARAPAVMPLRLDQVLAPVTRELGFDPRTLEQLVVLLAPAPAEPAKKDKESPGTSPLMPAAILRFADKVDGLRLLGEALGGVEKNTFQEFIYYRSKSADFGGALVAGYVANDRTLVVAPEPTLHKMLLAADVKSGLVERLRTADLNHDLSVVAVMDPAPFRALLGELLQPVKTAHKEYAVAATLPERVQAVTATLNFGGATLLRLALDADTAETAMKLEAQAKDARGRLWGEWPELRKDLDKRLGPELAGPALAAADQAVPGISTSRADRRVTISVAMPPALPGLMQKLAAAFQKAQEPPAPPKPVKP